METALLVAAIAGAWFWLDSLHARDIAVEAGRQTAQKYGLQLLDETVAFAHLWAARDAFGRLRFQRTYHFEVSDTGTNRLPCSITLLGKQVEVLDIPPHRDTLH
ncbi:MAG: hypothetical protein A3B82_03835 [Methylophilales bacterium RIFCSPHIGHO2_02_FULL_57_10]|nr:MAG: hypothetical protein A3B82_03835 [Methylophilales bacterium RIFCSPHIGHO2_02_FULL_57_10]